MARVFNSLKIILKQSPCLVHTPGTCSGSCADATANGAAARDWVYTALGWEGIDATPLGPAIQEPQRAGGVAGSSAAAEPSRGAGIDASVQDEQAKAALPRRAAAADSSTAAGSTQLASLQQHQQQLPA